MGTQVCNHCGISKSLEEFNWRWKNQGKRQSTCRTCQNKQKSRWYQKNKEIHKANISKNKVRNGEISREFIWNYLSTHPCEVCGESDPYVLEFDHVRGKKRAEVTKLVRDGNSIKIIQKKSKSALSYVLIATKEKRTKIHGVTGMKMGEKNKSGERVS